MKPIETFAVQKSDAEWKDELPPESFCVLRQHGTERRHESARQGEYRPGIFNCVACAQPLFLSHTKFDSGTGWPSFFQPIACAIATAVDSSHVMKCTEVSCSRCCGHLRSIFPAGPKPTGARHCISGVAL